MKIRELLDYLEERVPLSQQEGYDNSGVQCGDTSQELRAVLVAIDTTEAVVDEAIAKGCNLIVTHHPALFRGVKSITPDYYINRIVIKAIKHDIVLYASHTSLDNDDEGVNIFWARKMGLQNVKILSPIEGNPNVGAGVIGDLPSPRSIGEVVEQMKAFQPITHVAHSKPLTEKIKKVAYCGGSGNFLMPMAIEEKADLFITGEAKYNDYYDAEGEILLMTIGHYESELLTKELLKEIMSEKKVTLQSIVQNRVSIPCIISHNNVVKVMAKKKEESPKEISVEERLKALYQLQIVSSEIDRIRTMRGELPMEVEELADDLEGKNKRKERYQDQIDQNKHNIEKAKESIRTAEGMVEKYKQHLNDVRNDKEYDAISKELENLELDILKYEKAIREYQEDSQYVKEEVATLTADIKEVQEVYQVKNKELDAIIADTKAEEEKLRINAKSLEELIDPQLLAAFKRTRKSTHNGVAVAPIQRDACSGCFNLIPPQREIDVRSHKKIIACEYCGRVLIDEELATEVADNFK